MSYIKSLLNADEILNKIRSGQATQETRVKSGRGIVAKPTDLETPDLGLSSFESAYSALADIETRIKEAKAKEMPEGTGSNLELSPESPSEPRPRRNPVAFVADAKGMSERDLLAMTLQAESGGEGYEGLLATGAVIANRVSAKGYGNSFKDVILAPGQFSAWNSVTGYAGGKGGLDMSKIRPSEEAYKVADQVLAGKYESPVGGATHYYNPNVVEPKWGKSAGGSWQDIGNHRFGFGN